MAASTRDPAGRPTADRAASTRPSERRAGAMTLMERAYRSVGEEAHEGGVAPPLPARPRRPLGGHRPAREAREAGDGEPLGRHHIEPLVAGARRHHQVAW